MLIGLHLALLMLLLDAPAPPPGPADWPERPVRIELTAEDARHTLWSLSSGHQVDPRVARRIAQELISELTNIPEPKQSADGLWRLQDRRHGITWAHTDPWKLRAWCELVEAREINAPTSHRSQPVPTIIGLIDWGRWRANRSRKDAKP
jgi:hypothetical protein